jgi:hypothetical protein
VAEDVYTQTIHRTTQITNEQHKYNKCGRVRAVPRLCEIYPGICLTIEEKARKNLSQDKKTSVRLRKTSVRVRKTSVRLRKILVRVRKTSQVKKNLSQSKKNLSQVKKNLSQFKKNLSD